MTKPFLKWVGGKTQLLPQLLKFLPSDIESRNYIEPFVGGGAFFFSLNTNKYVLLNDINEDLIDTYRVVRDNPKELIILLRELQSSHSIENYYNIRDLYNSRKLGQLKKAAYFIYMNKTCFNGLYRVNKKDKFNVPAGKYKNPKICDENVVLKTSCKLQNVKLRSLDFESLFYIIDSNSFIYLDPPYEPITKTSNFKEYTKSSFNREDQERLRGFFKKLSGKGCKCMLSNSNCDFIVDLYKDFSIQRVEAKRSINCKGDKRGKVFELIIRNY